MHRQNVPCCTRAEVCQVGVQVPKVNVKPQECGKAAAHSAYQSTSAVAYASMLNAGYGNRWASNHQHNQKVKCGRMEGILGSRTGITLPPAPSQNCSRRMLASTNQPATPRTSHMPSYRQNAAMCMRKWVANQNVTSTQRPSLFNVSSVFVAWCGGGAGRWGGVKRWRLV